MAGSQPAWASYFDTGNELYDVCQKPKGSALEGACIGTISGGYDMLTALGYRCEDDGVTRGQLRDVVVKNIFKTTLKREISQRPFTSFWRFKRPSLASGSE
jgi:hypothetical protein